MDYVVDMLYIKRDADQIRCDTTLDNLFIWNLLVRGAPRVNNECLCVANVGEMSALEDLSVMLSRMRRREFVITPQSCTLEDDQLHSGSRKILASRVLSNSKEGTKQ